MPKPHTNPLTGATKANPPDRCRCSGRANQTVTIHPCGCAETKCATCGPTPIRDALTLRGSTATHGCGHTAPITSWHVTREPLL